MCINGHRTSNWPELVDRCVARRIEYRAKTEPPTKPGWYYARWSSDRGKPPHEVLVVRVDHRYETLAMLEVKFPNLVIDTGRSGSVTTSLETRPLSHFDFYGPVNNVIPL